MRRQLAIYTPDDRLVSQVWVDEADIPEFERRNRTDGYRVVDVIRASQFERAVDSPPSRPSRLRHILRNP